jgi:hypothetical protein
MHNHGPRDKRTDEFTVRITVRGRVRGQQGPNPYCNIPRKNRHLAALNGWHGLCKIPNRPRRRAKNSSSAQVPRIFTVLSKYHFRRVT